MPLRPTSNGEKRFTNPSSVKSKDRIAKGEVRYTSPVPTLAQTSEFTPSPYRSDFQAHLRYAGDSNSEPSNSIIYAEMTDLVAIYNANRD